MITEKEYLEAQMIIKLYESQQLNISGFIGSSILKPPEPPKDRRWKVIAKSGDILDLGITYNISLANV